MKWASGELKAGHTIYAQASQTKYGPNVRPLEIVNPVLELSTTGIKLVATVEVSETQYL